jgi:hypothetical protein
MPSTRERIVSFARLKTMSIRSAAVACCTIQRLNPVSFVSSVYFVSSVFTVVKMDGTRI